MTDVIVEYQKWKAQGEDLRAKAKLAMETRYRDLLQEAVRVAEEYKSDFGGTLKPPASVTAFRYKAGKAKKKVAPGPKATPAPKAAPAPAPVAPAGKKAAPAPKPDRALGALQKRLAVARQKLEAAKAAGKPTRDLDDKVYELEDALRVAQAED
jgi:hypothetical protein